MQIAQSISIIISIFEKNNTCRYSLLFIIKKIKKNNLLENHITLVLHFLLILLSEFKFYLPPIYFIVSIEKIGYEYSFVRLLRE